MDETLRIMMDIAREAAAEVYRIYQGSFQVDYKGPNDPVTEADRQANELICSRLEMAFPGVPVVAEESSPDRWNHFRSHNQVFFVDPIDGTREFVAKNGQFVVMIGLLAGDTPTHGVLHAPASDTVWAGNLSDGAIKIEASGATTQLSTLTGPTLDQATVAVPLSHHPEKQRALLQALGTEKTFPIASTGLKGAALADGRAHVYLSPGRAGYFWDTCAPEAIIRSLGGAFTDAAGVPIDYRATTVENVNGAVAAAPALHSEVIRALREQIR